MYAELHCKTNYSFLEGASHPDELVVRAAELAYAALAITDRNSLAGVVRAHEAAKNIGLKLVIGAEITPSDAPPVVLWAIDRAGYGRLSRLITLGRRRAPKGECQLTFDDVAEHAEGLLAGGVACRERPPWRSEIHHNARNATEGVPYRVIAENSYDYPSRLHDYRDLFGERGYLLAELQRGPDDEARLTYLIELSRKTRLPLVAAGDVHYHTPARLPLHDVLTAIRLGTTVAAAAEHLFPNAQRQLKSLEEIRAVFARVPEAIARTREIADRCTFSLDELRYEYPEELAPPSLTPLEYLSRLAWAGAKERYPGGLPDKVRGLIEYELQLIADLRYEAYFLTVWDLIRFARERGILSQGRGSAANSAVCYCLGVTAVDPGRSDVLFERFISRERDEAPDIDVDFEHERREEVLQYLYDKYGRERAGLTAVVITYRSRSSIRDVGKALGLSLDRVDALAKQVEGYTREPLLAERCRQIGLDPDSDIGRRLVHLVNELIGFPRHLSQHVGGMVITRGPLCELSPLENAAMPGRTVIQWDKDDLDTLGILKVDCLALGMLTAIRKCFSLVRQHTGRELTLANIPAEDPRVYDMICEADTIGVFQIESRAQMSMLPRLKPRCYYDLVIEVAIVRPGPIQGNMVHPYLRRRAGDEAVTYPNDAIRDVLHKTLGVPIFQEQAMRLAVVAAGFTPGEADQLRRAMGAWRRPGIIDDFRRKLIDGMLARGLSAEFAEQVFSQIRGFGEYGFPESHSASFALLVYASAWLKHYYPAAFAAAMVNSQPLGFYAPAQLIRDARQHGVEVQPVDVNRSEWDCTLEVIVQAKPASERLPLPVGEGWGEGCATDSRSPHPALSQGERVLLAADSLRAAHSPLALRLGFRLLSGFSEKHAQRIVAARGDLPFRDLHDFTPRTGLSRAVLLQLAEADALRSLGSDRRGALWASLGEDPRGKTLPLFAEISPDDEPPVALPPLSLAEEVRADYRTAGLSLRAHPLSFYREELSRLGVVTADGLSHIEHDQPVRVAGLVLLRQRPGTAKGITFVTLEDETGTANLVLHQQVWERNYLVARRSPAWIAHGRLERKDKVIHVVVRRLEDLSQRLKDHRVQSRDFR